MIYINYLNDLYAYFKGFVQIIETIYRKGMEDSYKSLKQFIGKVWRIGCTEWKKRFKETIQRDGQHRLGTARLSCHSKEKRYVSEAAIYGLK